jgi:hypothetical protein
MVYTAAVKTLLLKLDSELYAGWKTAAVNSGLNVSEWIRKQCNRGMETRVDLEKENGSNGSSNDQDVSRTNLDSVRKRRTNPERRVNRRGTGTLRAIEDAAHGASRRTTAGINGAVSGISADDDEAVLHASTAEVEPNELVTRENFFQIAASIPSDELDYWARRLPADVLPSHGTNRNVCLCSYCLGWRKTNAIPNGGLLKKDKAPR